MYFCVCRYKTINMRYKKYPIILYFRMCTIPHIQRVMAEWQIKYGPVAVRCRSDSSPFS